MLTNLDIQAAIAKKRSNPTAANQVPVANAGADNVITLPASSIQLSGGQSVDPDGSIVAYSWSQVSGANTATFSSTTVASPIVTGLIAGVYIFSLTVLDNKGASASDTVKVTVNNASSSSKTPVIHIIGQSNAGGANEGSTGMAAHLRVVMPYASIQTNAGGATTVGDGTYASLNGAGQVDVGMEYNLAYTFNQATGNNIAINKWYVGGSKVAVRGSGADWNPSSVNEYMDRSSTSLDNFLAKLTADGKNPVLHAVVWDIGENDAQDGTTQSTWVTAMKANISKLRTRYNLPNLAIFIVRTKNWNETITGLLTIRAAQEQVVAETPNSYLINRDDAAMVSGDPIHVSAAGQQLVGQRVADIVKTIGY